MSRKAFEVHGHFPQRGVGVRPQNLTQRTYEASFDLRGVFGLLLCSLLSRLLKKQDRVVVRIQDRVSSYGVKFEDAGFSRVFAACCVRDFPVGSRIVCLLHSLVFPL